MTRQTADRKEADFEREVFLFETGLLYQARVWRCANLPLADREISRRVQTGDRPRIVISCLTTPRESGSYQRSSCKLFILTPRGRLWGQLAGGPRYRRSAWACFPEGRFRGVCGNQAVPKAAIHTSGLPRGSAFLVWFPVHGNWAWSRFNKSTGSSHPINQERAHRCAAVCLIASGLFPYGIPLFWMSFLLVEAVEGLREEQTPVDWEIMKHG